MALTLDGTNGIVSSGSITTQSATGVIFSDSSSLPAASSPYVLKNRIINGDMVIDQRNAGASVTASATSTFTYTLDRWAYYATQTNKYTVQQDAGAVTPPVGFNDYLGVTSSSAYSVAAGDLFLIKQSIEGYNVADLAWGTANAKTVTLSFWVRSSLTGTFGGAVGNSAGNRQYPFSYTISSANTWEQKTITIAGDTTGTWLTTNGNGLSLYFGLGVGSTYLGTAGAWGTSAYSATGATSVVGTNGATWYITGVQLEVGSTATPFERRLYGQELINCQRYYEKSYDYSVVPGTATGTGAVFTSGSNGGVTTSYLSGSYEYKVTKRGTPTNTYYDQSGNSGKCNREYFGVSSTANSTLTESFFGTTNALLFSTSGANSANFAFHYTSSSEL
jgi:hypothetical protein